MRKYLIIALLIISCNGNKAVNKNNGIPAWLSQNIDAEKSCEIILIDGMKLVRIGNSFTITYEDGTMKWYKSDKKQTGLDFDWDARSIVYYSDSCIIKEDLRWFIKMKMVANISSKLYQ